MTLLEYIARVQKEDPNIFRQLAERIIRKKVGKYSDIKLLSNFSTQYYVCYEFRINHTDNKLYFINVGIPYTSVFLYTKEQIRSRFAFMENKETHTNINGIGIF